MGIKDKSKIYNTNLVEYLEFTNVLDLSEIILVGAINRNESRGAHFREDAPEKNDVLYTKHTVSWKEEGILCVDLKD